MHKALALADVTFYLIHSMPETGDFRAEEHAMAKRFARAAEDEGVGRIVFLGGLHPSGEELSKHLGSRVEVGKIFLDSTVPTAALQAGVVLGKDSISFRMLRHLSELSPEVNRTFDIGGPDTLEYAAMMQEYAKTKGLLPRLVFSAPVTTPELAAKWISLVTPIKAKLATPLIGSLLHNTVVK